MLVHNPPEELTPINETVIFDAQRHLNLAKPDHVTPISEIGYSDEFFDALACKVAFTGPFRLLSEEGLIKLRSIADTLSQKKSTLGSAALDEFGNAAYLSPFIKAMGLCQEIHDFLSEITNTQIIPYVRMHFLAALNVGKPSGKKLVRRWHTDYQSLNLIIFLDDPSAHVGGKLQLYKGTKEEAEAFLKKNIPFPDDKIETIVPTNAGYAILIQGSLLTHSVTPLHEHDPIRRTLVLGFRSNDIVKNIFEYNGVAPDHSLCKYPEAAKHAASIAIQRLNGFIQQELYTENTNLILELLENNLREIRDLTKEFKN